MLAKQARLDRTAFSHYFKKGKRFHSPHLTIIYTSDTSQQKGAVVVSKKVAKQAPTRNTLRRRVYEALRLFWEADNSPKGVWIVMVKPEIKAVPRRQLQSLLLAEFGRVVKEG